MKVKLRVKLRVKVMGTWKFLKNWPWNGPCQQARCWSTAFPPHLDGAKQEQIHASPPSLPSADYYRTWPLNVAIISRLSRELCWATLIIPDNRPLLARADVDRLRDVTKSLSKDRSDVFQLKRFVCPPTKHDAYHFHQPKSIGSQEDPV